MSIFQIPVPKNEPVYSYAPSTKERIALEEALASLKKQALDIPMYIGGEEIRTEQKVRIAPPHELRHTLGYYHLGGKEEVEQAITAALNAKAMWEQMPWEQRASIFLKAADLIAHEYRYLLNAATMLGQSKSAYQAEIDAACEMIDFLRFNVKYMEEIYHQQPQSSSALWNRMEYRPLEGFVLAITPFNFTAIAGNLPTSAAMMGNVIIWKPAETQIYSAHFLMQAFRKAGVPDGVINLVYADGPLLGDIVFNHADFAGIHFTGGTKTFQTIWQIIGQNIHKYKSYPRIVGETGGKDFVVAHSSAHKKALATALVRGAFEYQGQKCSAASRAYIPADIWEEVKGYVLEDLKNIKMGSVEDFSNFINAVIDEKSYNKITQYIETAKQDTNVEVIAGGNFDKSKGYFIEPTILLVKDPMYVTMQEEIFGPVLTIYVYQPENFEETLTLVDRTSPYALTGAIFAQDRYAITLASEKLKHAAGNFYINDKPTGAVVGQQPFGGSRASGTNDKAGSFLNLVRWTSPRAIKENLVPAVDFRYPFMETS
ncbi:MAG: L-glutamate gamma-semialdehyde dehydrogenase [Bacteroidota bacterium]